MTEITKTSGLIVTISDIQSRKLNYNSLISELETELRNSELVCKIEKAKTYLRDLEKEELEVKANWITILEEAWIDKFEANGVEVRRKVSLWRLVIQDESLIPDQYKKEVVKTTITIDKKEIKENIKLWEIIEWVVIEQDVTLEIKYK